MLFFVCVCYSHFVSGVRMEGRNVIFLRSVGTAEPAARPDLSGNLRISFSVRTV